VTATADKTVTYTGAVVSLTASTNTSANG